MLRPATPSLLARVALIIGLAGVAPLPARAEPPLVAQAGAPGEAEPPRPTESQMRKPEILHEKPSGFWTSSRPAKGGAYRWRMLGIGVVVALGMAIVTYLVISRTRPGARRTR
jgi:hypothetical protein